MLKAKDAFQADSMDPVKTDQPLFDEMGNSSKYCVVVTLNVRNEFELKTETLANDWYSHLAVAETHCFRELEGA